MNYGQPVAGIQLRATSCGQSLVGNEFVGGSVVRFGFIGNDGIRSLSLDFSDVSHDCFL
jgi:hypothetical protein